MGNDIQEKKYSIEDFIKWVIAISITTVEGAITFSVNKFSSWPQYAYWIVGCIFIFFGIILEIKLKERKPFKQFRKPLLLIAIASVAFCSIPIIAYWFETTAIEKIRIEFSEKKNYKKIKVLVLPFSGGNSGNSIELGLWIEQVIDGNIKTDKLTDKVLVRYYDQNKAKPKDTLKFIDYGNEEYASSILNNMHADLLIFGERLPDGSVSYSWKSSDSIQKYLDSAIANRHLNANVTDPATIEEIRNGKITGCIDLIISFTSLQLDFLGHSYIHTIYRYNSIVNRYNLIKNDNSCQDCFIYKICHFIAAESSLNIWDNNNAQRIIASLDSINMDLSKNKDLSARKCDFSNEDSARYLMINSWIHFINDENQEGYDIANKAVSLFDTIHLNDVTQYINARLLVEDGLNSLGKIKEAITYSKKLVKICEPYPALSAINYCNLGGLFGRYAERGHIDSSFRYLKLAESKNKINLDSITLINIIQNYGYDYNILKRDMDTCTQDTTLRNSLKYKFDSTQLKHYFDLLDQIHVSDLEYSTLFKFKEMESKATRLQNISFTFLEEKNYDSAHAYCAKSLEILNYLSDSVLKMQPYSSLLVNIYVDLSLYYTFSDINHYKGIIYAQKALDVFKSNESCDYRNHAAAYGLIASNYKNIRNKDSCLYFCSEGIKFCDSFLDDIEIYPSLVGLDSTKAKVLRMQ